LCLPVVPSFFFFPLFWSLRANNTDGFNSLFFLSVSGSFVDHACYAMLCIYLSLRLKQRTRSTVCCRRAASTSADISHSLRINRQILRYGFHISKPGNLKAVYDLYFPMFDSHLVPETTGDNREPEGGSRLLRTCFRLDVTSNYARALQQEKNIIRLALVAVRLGCAPVPSPPPPAPE
jgi:hypothetical protein